MDTIDKIYIINKKENYINKDLCETQLLNIGLNNYTFIDAIYPSEHYDLRQMYDEICKNMTTQIIKNNFSIGALGCMLSHIKAIKHALQNNLKNILKDKNLTFSITDKALEWLVDKGFDQEYGARPLKRAIQRYIQNPIANLILDMKDKKLDAIKIDVDDDQLILNNKIFAIN